MPTDLERATLKYSEGRLGEFTEIRGWLNDDESKKVLIAWMDDSPERGLVSFSTVGLSQFDNYLEGGSGRPLRVEFVSAVADRFRDAFEGSMASSALNIASGDWQAVPRAVHPRTYHGNDPSITTVHMLLWYPFQWKKKFEGLTFEGLDIEWLLLIPITDAEVDFIIANGPGSKGAGVDLLIDAFERQRTDIYDMSRASAV